MKTSHPESGNVFIFILLGVALFGALAFTISRSMQSQSVSQMSGRESRLSATDLLDYAQKLERAVGRISRKGVSENDISFQNEADSGYTPGTTQPPEHQIFNTAGGSASWRTPDPNVNDGSSWLITGDTCIADIGTGPTGCDSDGEPNEELILVLPKVKESICLELDKMMNISTIPAETGDGYSTTKFTGTYSDGNEINVGAPYKTACYSKGGNFYFYHVLVAR